MKYIIDSYAWIEYLEGSILGQKVHEIVTNTNNEIISLSVTIAEVISRVKRKKGNVEIAFKAITSNAKIIEISSQVAQEAGLLHADMRQKIKNFGLVDSFLVILARKLDAKILTGDPHFKGFKETLFINSKK